jgi:hypothetical protein
VNPDVKYAMYADTINVGDTMLIKTTHDDTHTHFFIGLSDDDDTHQDYAVTTIYYKIWAINTGNKMLQTMNVKKINKDDTWYNL